MSSNKFDVIFHPPLTSATASDTTALDENVTARLSNWQHTTRRVGGYWLASASYNLANGTKDDMLDLFLNSLWRRVTEQVGGLVTWEGFISKLDLTWGGATYTRSLFNVANRLQTKYTRIGPNLLINGDVETDPDAGAANTWQAYRTPSQRVWSTEWAVRGTHSMFCEANDEQDGLTINSNVTVEPETAYQLSVSIKVDLGRWIVKVYETGTGNMIARGKTPRGELGEFTVRVDIPDTNTAVGVDITVEGKMPDGELVTQGFFDNAILQLAPSASDTQWYEDADSIATYGQRNEILLKGAMTRDAAAAFTQRELAERAWPRTIPPGNVGRSSAPDGLEITCAGYVWTLGGKYTLVYGNDAASTHVANIIAASDFVQTGYIKENLLDFLIPSLLPEVEWDMLQNIIQAGDGSNNKWEGGVYNDRKFDYYPSSTSVEYNRSGGQVLDLTGGIVNPWAVRPAIVCLKDMPVGPGEITGNIDDDPRNMRFDAATFMAPDGIDFSRETEY